MAKLIYATNKLFMTMLSPAWLTNNELRTKNGSLLWYGLALMKLYAFLVIVSIC